MLWIRISIRVRCSPLCDKVCQWPAIGRWFSPSSPVSSTNNADRHDMTEILLKVTLNTIKQTNKLNASIFLIMVPTNFLKMSRNFIHISFRCVTFFYRIPRVHSSSLSLCTICILTNLRSSKTCLRITIPTNSFVFIC